MHEAAKSLDRYGTRNNPIEIGECFGRWTVIGEAEPTYNQRGHRIRQLLCRCDCGNFGVKRPGSLRYGSSKSCGCLQREITKARATTHGATVGYRLHPLYQSWLQIRSRCRNPKNSRYAYYGGRGIDICDRWFGDFQAFVADMGPRPTPSHSVDRIDNNKGYQPSNCRWADKTTQARNTRKNRIIRVRGQDYVLAELIEKTGLAEWIIRDRLARGWHPDNVDAAKVSPSEAARRAGRARWNKIKGIAA